MGVAVFDYSVWSILYPTLAPKVPQPVAAAYFSQAGLYLNNTDDSIVSDVGARTQLFYLLVSHIAALNGATPASEAGLVGRISEASQGSVTIKTDLSASPGSEQWYVQTPWGFQYWEATAQYRNAQYIPGEQPFLGVPGYGGAAGLTRWPV